MNNLFPRLLATLLVALPVCAASQTSVSSVDSETPQTLNPVVVTGVRTADEPGGAARLDKQVLPAERANTSDTARLLENIPGVSSYGAGSISSLPVVHGIADDRLRTTVDGMDLMTACPNHMNPALSFIDPSKVASVEVFAGITPVSVGGDSIGGTIQVKSAPPKFAKPDEDFLAEGELGFFTRSNGNARGRNARAMLAGEWFNLSYSASESDSDNYVAAGKFKTDTPSAWKRLSSGRKVEENEVGATEYRGSINQEFGVALRILRRHTLAFSASEQRLNYEGFPNQRMDMISSVPNPDPTGMPYILDKDKPSNVNRLSNIHYSGQFEWGALEARYFHQDLKHHMDMLPERYLVLMMPMDTVATTDGGLLKASIDLSDTDILRVGYDFQKYRLDDWWPPVDNGGMGPNNFWNIRDGKRDRMGLFAEWEARWPSAWMTLLGIRGGVVESNAGRAEGYNNSYRFDANAFNARDHFRKDNHLDLTALARYTPDAMQTYEAGVARKTRSPNLYERYPWSFNSMATLMNNFVGDGNGYIGNPDLKPEIAHTISATADWHDENQDRWNIKATAYVTYVDDFIDAERCTQRMNTACTRSNATTTNEYVKLRYVNQSARLYGFDLSGGRLLGQIDGFGSFTATGVASYVRGENRTTGGNLFHIMPLNVKLGITHKLAGLTTTLEMQSVADKDKVSQVRNEVATHGYTLYHLRSSYQLKHARIDLAIENLFDQFYYLPLGGAYVGQGNSMTINGVPWGMNVPGRGRSLNMALNLTF